MGKGFARSTLLVLAVPLSFLLSCNGSDPPEPTGETAIRRYIDETYPGAENADERAAMHNVARTAQEMIDLANADSAETVDAVATFLRARECAFGVFGESGPDELHALDDMLFDTVERIEGYFKANEAFGDEFFTFHSDPLQACPTEPEGMGMSASAILEPAQASTCGGGTRIYFGNGVGTSLIGAQESLNLIRNAYEPALRTLRPDETFTFTLAHNATRGYFNDIREVFRQKFQELLGNDDPIPPGTAERLLRAISDARDLRDATDDRREARAYEAYISVLELAYFETGTTENHVQKYRTDLLAGNRVIVIAHSQGNLFANRARALLASDPAVGASLGSMVLVPVATPASYVDGGFAHFTAEDDRVINQLRRTHDVIGGAFDNDPGILNDSRDALNHYFGRSYFADNLLSRARIDNAFFGLVTGTPYPESEIGEGALTVTLEWGGQPDVDLHVFEPGGTHVYYGNRRGVSGYLDLDDVTGFGPEHYFVECLTPESENLDDYLGTYRVGVNYFSGEGPETARVQISVNGGQEIRTFTQPLPAARGSSGNDSPVPIANVTISLAEGALKYAISR